MQPTITIMYDVMLEDLFPTCVAYMVADYTKHVTSRQEKHWLLCSPLVILSCSLKEHNGQSCLAVMPHSSFQASRKKSQRQISLIDDSEWWRCGNDKIMRLTWFLPLQISVFSRWGLCSIQRRTSEGTPLFTLAPSVYFEFSVDTVGKLKKSLKI